LRSDATPNSVGITDYPLARQSRPLRRLCCLSGYP
jgi:hypothetical protein